MRHRGPRRQFWLEHLGIARVPAGSTESSEQARQYEELDARLREDLAERQRQRVAADQPGAQQRMGVDIAGTEDFAVAGLDRHRLTGLKIAQRRGGDVDFVAVDPEMTGAQAAVFVLAQAQRGEIGG